MPEEQRVNDEHSIVLGYSSAMLVPVSLRVILFCYACLRPNTNRPVFSSCKTDVCCYIALIFALYLARCYGTVASGWRLSGLLK